MSFCVYRENGRVYIWVSGGFYGRSLERISVIRKHYINFNTYTLLLLFFAVPSLPTPNPSSASSSSYFSSSSLSSIGCLHSEVFPTPWGLKYRMREMQLLPLRTKQAVLCIFVSGPLEQILCDTGMVTHFLKDLRSLGLHVINNKKIHIFEVFNRKIFTVFEYGNVTCQSQWASVC